MAKLGNFVNIKTGKLDANASSVGGKYPFFTCAATPLRIDSYSYDCECALVAGNGDLNVKYYNGKFDAYQRTYIIESKDKTILTVPYLYRFLEKYVETLRTLSIGGVIKYIKLGNLTDADIKIRDINEQRKIVYTLEKIDSLLNNLEKQLLYHDILIKSRFVELFGDPVTNPHGWDKVPLSDLAEIKIGPFGTLLHKEDYITGGHALVNP
ncbi:MAG: restriction endonuclease subunit S, partial [Selenomonas sp.]|nr:restriction endonuclease subunit S [Selenomonas sp.]